LCAAKSFANSVRQQGSRDSFASIELTVEPIPGAVFGLCALIGCDV
jgi:hypothetical protein